MGSLKLLRPTEHMLHYGAIMLNENDVVEAVCAYLTANWPHKKVRDRKD